MQKKREISSVKEENEAPRVLKKGRNVNDILWKFIWCYLGVLKFRMKWRESGNWSHRNEAEKRLSVSQFFNKTAEKQNCKHIATEKTLKTVTTAQSSVSFAGGIWTKNSSLKRSLKAEEQRFRKLGETGLISPKRNEWTFPEMLGTSLKLRSKKKWFQTWRSKVWSSLLGVPTWFKNEEHGMKLLSLQLIILECSIGD